MRMLDEIQCLPVTIWLEGAWKGNPLAHKSKLRQSWKLLAGISIWISIGLSAELNPKSSYICLIFVEIIAICQYLFEFCQYLSNIYQYLFDICQYLSNICQYLFDICQYLSDICQSLFDICQYLSDICQYLFDICWSASQFGFASDWVSRQQWILNQVTPNPQSPFVSNWTPHLRL